MNPGLLTPGLESSSHPTLHPGCFHSGLLLGENTNHRINLTKEIRHPFCPLISRNSAIFLCPSCPQTQWEVSQFIAIFTTPHSLESTLDATAKHKLDHITPCSNPSRAVHASQGNPDSTVLDCS
jgi:hypothetical protein